MVVLYLFPAGNDIRHDGVNKTKTFDGTLEAILAVGNLGLDVQQTLLDNADQSPKISTQNRGLINL